MPLRKPGSGSRTPDAKDEVCRIGAAARGADEAAGSKCPGRVAAEGCEVCLASGGVHGHRCTLDMAFDGSVATLAALQAMPHPIPMARAAAQVGQRINNVSDIVPQTMAHPQPYTNSALVARHYSFDHVDVVLRTTAHPQPTVLALVAQHGALSVVDALQAMAHPLPTVLALVAQRDVQLVVPIVVRVLQAMAHPPPSCRALVAQHIIPHCCLYAVSAAIMTYAGGAAI